MKKIEKILVVNVNWLGDVVFSTPVFKALRQAYPGAKITCLGVPRIKAVLENSPCVDAVMVYDEDGRHSTPWGKGRLILELRRQKFDIVFLLHRSMTRALLAFLAGIPVRVGYDIKAKGPLLTHRVKAAASEELLHRSDYYLRVVESFGVPVKDRICELRVDPAERMNIEEVLKKHGVNDKDFVVVVNVGGNWDLKRWPKENFARLIYRLSREYTVKIVIPGAPKDVELVESIARTSEVSPIILAGQTNLKQLASLLQRANLVISSDSGPLHVAHGVGTSVIGLFGPTRLEVTGPRGKGGQAVIFKDVGCNRQPCYHLRCPDNICMQSITVDEVLEKVRQLPMPIPQRA
ncbi:MAG: lipopolysaccharide heptosyltransferase II [Omnitrophica WOR_2 bacterium RIFCSPHIGHO2_02_FULL_48_11]|nr:MAG: lipopolysaccharide heptosyltransferase II [Omnitrophica WOR_2 bacterium RIFCSPHIGHO2_02_FULL_48_11]